MGNNTCKEKTLLVILGGLKDAQVLGEGEKDEPEGTRYIKMTDTLRKELIKKIDLCFIDSPDIAICNGLKFGEIKSIQHRAVTRETGPVCPEMLSKEKVKKIEESSKTSMAASIVFEKLNKDIIKTFSNKQQEFDIIKIQKNEEYLKEDYMFLSGVKILNEGKELPIKSIETNKKYTFVASPISRV